MKWVCGCECVESLKKDKIWSENICEMEGVVPIGDKLRENRLYWLGCVQRALVKKSDKIMVDGYARRRGGPKLTWDDVVKHDMNVLNLTQHVDLNRI